jgi:hypothetical protein
VATPAILGGGVLKVLIPILAAVVTVALLVAHFA